MSCSACRSEQRRGCARGSSGLWSQVGTRALLSSFPLSPDCQVTQPCLTQHLLPDQAQLSLQCQPTLEAVERELREDISTIHTSLCPQSTDQGKSASGWPHQNPTHGIPAPHLALPTSEPAALSLLSAHICLWNRLSLIPLAWVLLPGQCLKSPPFLAGWFLVVLNGMHPCGCCDANQVAMVLILPIIFVQLAGLTIHLELAQQHQNLME